MGIWSNAFKIPEPEDLSQEDKDLIYTAVKKIKARKLDYVVDLITDASRPIQGIGRAGLGFFEPFIGMIFGYEKAKRFTALMENPKAIEFFKQALEKNGEK